jgi:molecular chaperone GrpE|tara:strand:- start:244 stop:876 length:633 start_codon:yes stop_codon:yes gene_type:complete
MIKSEKNDIEKISKNENESNSIKEKEENSIKEKEENSIKEKEETIEEKFKISQEKLLRTMAEMENQRRRFEKERQEAFEFGGFNFAKESLSLLDNIDRAVNSFENDESLKNNKGLNKIIEGIDVVKKDLISIFKKNGIEAINCIDKKFDPNYHQAMLEIENNSKDPGTVLEEMQKGYMMKGRLLRPSLVSVTKKMEENINKATNSEETSK